MPIFSVQFSVTVSGVGAAVVTIPNITATDAGQAITVAQSTLVQVQAIGVLRTAP